MASTTTEQTAFKSAHPVTIKAGRTLRVNLLTREPSGEGPGTLELHDVQGEDGTPFTGFAYLIPVPPTKTDWEYRKVRITGGHGIETGLPIGRYRLSKTRPVTATGGDLEVRATRGGEAYSGVAFLIPVPPTAPGWTSRTVNLENGVGTVTGVPVGEYRLSLKQPVKPDPEPERPANRCPPLPTLKLYFETGSAKLPANSDQVLEHVLCNLGLPEHKSVDQVLCIGHTDNVGSRVSNDNLSLQRAMAASRALESRLEVLPREPRAKAVPDARGQLPGDSAEERKENRRVEFEFKTSRVRPVTRAVTILLDVSGSMTDTLPRAHDVNAMTRQKAAQDTTQRAYYQAALALERQLVSAASLTTFELLFFFTNTVRSEIARSSARDFRAGLNAVKSTLAGHDFKDYTPLAEALRRGASSLISSQAARRVLICITDGVGSRGQRFADVGQLASGDVESALEVVWVAPIPAPSFASPGWQVNFHRGIDSVGDLEGALEAIRTKYEL